MKYNLKGFILYHDRQNELHYLRLGINGPDETKIHVYNSHSCVRQHTHSCWMFNAYHHCKCVLCTHRIKLSRLVFNNRKGWVGYLPINLEYFFFFTLISISCIFEIVAYYQYEEWGKERYREIERKERESGREKKRECERWRRRHRETNVEKRINWNSG